MKKFYKDHSFKHLLKTPIEKIPFIVFDIETTGGNPDRNKITEISAIKFSSGQVQEHFYSLVNPEMFIPPIVRRITGIDNKLVKDAPTVEEVFPKFYKFIYGGVLVSHNAQGDLKFLRHFSQVCCKKILSNYFLCTHILIEKLYPEIEKKSLQEVGKYFNLSFGDLHRAEADALLTLETFKKILLRLDHLMKLEEVLRLQGDFDSLLNLGPKIPKSEIRNMAKGSGVIKFYDSKKKISLVSSIQHPIENLQKIFNPGKISKKIIRLIFNAEHYDFQETGSFFEAMLLENKLLMDHHIILDTFSELHQWHFMGIRLGYQHQKFYLSMGHFEAGFYGFWGPVRDRKKWQEITDELNRMLVELKFTFENCEDVYELMGVIFLDQREHYFKALEKKTKSWLRFLQRDKNNIRKKILHKKNKMLDLKISNLLHDVLKLQGKISIYEKNQQNYANYFFENIFQIEKLKNEHNQNTEVKWNQKINISKLMNLKKEEARLARVILWEVGKII